MKTFSNSDIQLKKSTLKALLNDTQEILSKGNVSEAMPLLFSGLREIHINSNVDEWKELAEYCINHPLRDLIHENPLTSRSFHKPRGYSGDAVLLDMIYSHPLPPGYSVQSSEIGEEINRFLKNESAALAIGARLKILAQSIDDIANHNTSPRILSVAAGHLREAELSNAIQNGLIGELIALDQDKESLEEIKRCYANKYPIKTLQSTLRPILTGKHNLKSFDLVYAAGLYDYLNHRIACRLTERLFSLLNSGGQLIFSNFLPQVPAIGYMESYMGWYLITRSPNQIESISTAINPHLITRKRVYVEENKNIVFLSLTKN